MKMGDIELSLDEIIRKKLKKTDLKRAKNNAGGLKKPIRRLSDQNNRISKNTSMGRNLRTPLTKNSRGPVPPPNIGDARNKIIQKHRQKMTDAREKLGQIAKQTDARLRLLKLRERQKEPISGVRITQPRAIPEHPILQRTVSSRINDSIFDEEMMDYSDSVPYLNRNYTERAVLDGHMYGYPFRSRPDPAALYRTIENDLPPNRLYDQEKAYSWSKPHLSPVDDFSDIPAPRINSRVLMGMGRTDEIRGGTPSWDIDDTPIVITKKVKPQETVSILKGSMGSVYDGQSVKITKESSPPVKSKAPIRTLSERFCQEGNASAQKINLLKAKLEASQKSTKSTVSEAQAPLGHRIVVSNLVSSVTHEDVKELFEDIGELISSKVVRPGTAEVVYKLHKDAVRAVDVYHNRQLDGQPMKCLLVNNRSTLALTSKSLKATDKKLVKPIVEVDMTAFRKALHKKSTS